MRQCSYANALHKTVHLRYLLSLSHYWNIRCHTNFFQPSQLTNTNWTDWINIFSRIDFYVENNIYIISKQLTFGNWEGTQSKSQFGSFPFSHLCIHAFI